jgi:hypothetical protein
MTHRNCPVSHCFYPWCKTCTFTSATSEHYMCILSLTNSTLWNDSCTSNHIPVMIFIPFFIHESTILCQFSDALIPFDHLYSHTKSNQYFASSLTTVFSEPDTGKVFTYHTCTFLCLGDSKWYVQVQDPLLHMTTRLLRVGCWLLAPCLSS